MTDSHQSLQEINLVASLEALLFVAPGPVTVTQLAAAVELPASEVEAALQELEAQLDQHQGLSLQRHGGRVQLTTSASHGELIERFLGLEATSRLSRAGLEALAIVAYQQPVTRPQLDSIRGVSSDGVIKSLLSKGLIQEMGRTEGPGRPIMYGTTPDFLQYFGLSSLQELPSLEKFDTGVQPPDENQSLLKD